MQPGGLEVIQALGGVDIIKSFAGLQLDQETALDQQISGISANDDPIVGHRNRHLLLSLETRFPQFMKQGILIDPFEKARPQRIGHLERAPKDRCREGILSTRRCAGFIEWVFRAVH